MKLSDIKIGYKILAIIGAFGLTAVGMSFWQNSVMSQMQSQYKGIITNSDPALLAAARMRQNLYALQGSVYGLAFQECPSQRCRYFASLAKESVQGFNTRYQEAVTSEPKMEKELRHLKQRFDDVSKELSNQGVAYGLANNSNELRSLLGAKDSEIEQLAKDIGATVDRLQYQNKAAADELEATMVSQGRLGLVLSLLITAVITGLAALLAFGDISKMLGRLTLQMQAIANGELDKEVDGQERMDEIGSMAKALAIFRQSLSQAEAVRRESDALKAKSEEERRQTMLDLANGFEKSVGGIVTLVSSAATEMQAAASQLSATAQEASAQSIAVSAAAEQAGANVNSVAASAEELGASVNEISRQVDTSVEVVKTAVAEAEAAGQMVLELDETAASIGSVVDLISGLAGQTNLLALNATIESARAGEAGKGFAVVAAEVKALAAQTAKATTEISAKIMQIQEATKRASAAMYSISGTIQNMSHTSTVIASAVEQQTSATREIVQAVNQASAGTQEVTSNIAGVASAAEQTGEAAVQVQNSSAELAQQAERLHHEMDKFLTSVRAA